MDPQWHAILNNRIPSHPLCIGRVGRLVSSSAGLASMARKVGFYGSACLFCTKSYFSFEKLLVGISVIFSSVQAFIPLCRLLILLIEIALLYSFFGACQTFLFAHDKAYLFGYHENQIALVTLFFLLFKGSELFHKAPLDSFLQNLSLLFLCVGLIHSGLHCILDRMESPQSKDHMPSLITLLSILGYILSQTGYSFLKGWKWTFILLCKALEKTTFLFPREQEGASV
ncbi:hypothetical protein [Candidatus Similichlamydia laticola]|uniref:Uncharacterized protein n=1 Tax=Candidatus Similichlamydia laticola TaxID=2170265 RepID=A0A369K9F7_9BACT|nr:hypothetical protein [Candidatus Similichlamydia laticola]RDB31221.1 hypothetical protein HAT2_00701 [Candidatus Similichlamydia laticola]